MPTIRSWNPEDPAAWAGGQSRTAWRNLAVSVPALLVAFSVWMFWSILAVRMQDAGFPFTPAQLFTLISIAGLSGATLRIPSSFLVSLAGGRNTVAVTTALLIVPALGAGLALQDPPPASPPSPSWRRCSGIGGGNFASSMANIPGFFPKRIAGTALGLNGGLGNLGVSVMQWLIPAVIGTSLFGTLAGAPAHHPRRARPSTCQNGALVWVPIAGAAGGAGLVLHGQPAGPGQRAARPGHPQDPGPAPAGAGGERPWRVALLLGFKLGLLAQVGVLLAHHRALPGPAAPASPAGCGPGSPRTSRCSTTGTPGP